MASGDLEEVGLRDGLLGIKWGYLATERTETLEKRLEKLILSVISVASPPNTREPRDVYYRAHKEHREKSLKKSR
jgi:hypothetical protein